MAPTREGSNAVASALGDKIRAMRQRLKRTLEEIAMAAGISKPFLSQVERGLASPSLTSLAGIADALGVSMHYFVDTPLDESAVRRGEQLEYFRFADSSSRFARLTYPSGEKQLEAILVRIPTGLTRTELRTCTGEQFFYVIDGEVELEVDEKKVTLRAGDSSHHQSTATRRWTNTSEKEAVVVCVGTP
jgi:transcriptional regulator with XRE-family HTH domain